jgi:hypothetical protein
LLLSVTFSLAKHIGVKNVRVTGQISQEFKVNFIPCTSFRW